MAPEQLDLKRRRDCRRSPSALADTANLRLPALGPRLRQGRRSALAKACAAVPGLRVHDALAGWGTDGLVLAALGCRVHMSERNPRVYAVLEQRLEEKVPGCACHGTPTCRTSDAHRTSELRLTWELEDARSRWQGRDAFDVIYLDPMFDEHPKTARPAKHMQVLASIADRVDDLGALLAAARRSASSRVVIKRRASARPVVPPDWSIDARSVRFDVYRPADTA